MKRSGGIQFNEQAETGTEVVSLGVPLPAGIALKGQVDLTSQWFPCVVLLFFDVNNSYMLIQILHMTNPFSPLSLLEMRQMSQTETVSVTSESD